MTISNIIIAIIVFSFDAWLLKKVYLLYRKYHPKTETITVNHISTPNINTPINHPKLNFKDTSEIQYFLEIATYSKSGAKLNTLSVSSDLKGYLEKILTDVFGSIINVSTTSDTLCIDWSDDKSAIFDIYELRSFTGSPQTFIDEIVKQFN